MRALVVYESLFGCTRAVAEAVGAGLASADVSATCVHVSAASADLPDVRLLVVGGPTHLLGMASTISCAMESQYERRVLRGRPGSRRMTPDAIGPGLRLWLSALPVTPRLVPAAVFDTRVPARVPGGAAPGIARRLRRRGYRLLVDPETFLVDGIAGPLSPGELDRAARWGAGLGRRVSAMVGDARA